MRKYFWIVVILVFGTILRFFHNTDISLWHDEAFSALLIKYPWGEMMYRIGLDVHPPMYYVFLRVWHYVLGDSLLSLRAFSVFFSVGTIWAVWLFVRTAFIRSGQAGEKLALWAAALIAINPFQIQYATEARMYTMGAFFALLAAYFLVKALHYQSDKAKDESLAMPNLPSTTQDRRRMLWNYFGFTLSVIIIIYTHYYLLFAAAAICFYGLVYLYLHHQGSFFAKFRWLLLTFIVIVIAYIPWLKIFLFQYKQVGAGYWIPPMDKWSISSTLYTLLVGFSHDVNQSGVQKLLILISLVVIFVVYKFLRKTQSFHKWLVLLVTLAPFAGSILFLILAKLKGSGSSVYLVRYFIFTGSFLTVMVAVVLAEIKYKKFAIGLFAGYILLNFWAFGEYWKDLRIDTRPGMTAAAKYLKTNIEPGDKLVAGTSFEFFNLKYYAKQFNITQTPLLYSGGTIEASNLPHFAGTAILTNEDLLPDFNRDVKNSDTVWLVWTNGFGGTKPSVPGNWTQIGERQYPEVRPYVGTNIYVDEYKVN